MSQLERQPPTPADAIRTSDAVIGLSGGEPVSSWVHELQWLIAAGLLSADQAVDAVIDRYIHSDAHGFDDRRQ
jgi:hypothetical protein